MSTQIQSSVSWTETLRARKEHLTALLKIVSIKTGKTTTVQELTINLIKAEMAYMEDKIQRRK